MYTSDVERGIAFALHVEAGMTPVNDTTANDDVHAAFGGEKIKTFVQGTAPIATSGLGRFGGDWVDEFTTHHWVGAQHVRRSLPY